MDQYFLSPEGEGGWHGKPCHPGKPEAKPLCGSVPSEKLLYVHGDLEKGIFD
jgi:hypothetical protein